jgi:site-specific recombinase XerC
VLIGRYQRYLQDERALSVSSIRNYVGVARLFLSYLSDRGDLELGAVSAGVVTEFVMEECRRGKVASSKAMTTRLRSLLRFLHVESLHATAWGDPQPPANHPFDSAAGQGRFCSSSSVALAPPSGGSRR